MTPTITEQATRSVKWSALAEAVSRTASPIVAVILARLLTPGDFGVMAAALIPISFAQMFWDAGLGKALVQKSDEPAAAADVVFWTNLGLAFAVYGLLFAFAPWLSSFFGSPESGLVLRVLGLQIVLASLTSVQQALLVRALNFRALFWVRFLAALVPGIFSIPLALSGYGVWALAAGALAGQAATAAAIWHISTWRPRVSYDRHLAAGLFRFGVWVLAESLGGWFIMWGDSVVVGRFLGVHELGLYRTGWMLVSIAFGLVLNPLLPVLYPTFSRLQGDPRLLRSRFHSANRVVISLSVPMGTTLMLLGPEIAAVVFGAKWEGLGPVLAIVGVSLASAWLVGINAELYRALGRPDVNAKIIFFAILYYLPAYYFAARSGLGVFLYVRCALSIAAIPIHVLVYRRMMQGSALYLWRDGKPFYLAAIVMGTSIALARWGLSSAAPALPGAVELVLFGVVGASTYVAAIWLLDRAFVLQVSRLVVRAASA